MTRTLVVAPNWIGDALMAQPLLAQLRAADPGQTICALAPRWVAPVLEAMPEIDSVIATDLAHGKLQWGTRLDLASEVRAQNFDQALILPNSLKSALIPWLAGIPRRCGYMGEMRYGLLNQRLPKPDQSLAMAARYAALGTLALRPTKPVGNLPPPKLGSDATIARSTRIRFGLAVDEPMVALCPGAEYGPAKRWPAQHFAQLAQQLAKQRPSLRIILLGGPGDRAIADEIVAHAGGTVRSPLNLAGSTSLTEAIALLASAEAVVSNDSGLMHVAAALGRPQIALFGSSDPRHTPPLSPAARVIWLHTECSPCFKRTCPLGHMRCLNELAPQQVFETLQPMLADD